MTTDQINLAEAPAGATEVESTPDEVLNAAREQAREILAKARYDAFRMVTDARNEAESILADVSATSDLLAGESASDEEHRDTRVAEAKARAEEILVEARAEAERVAEERQAELEAESARLREHNRTLEERAESTKALLEDLEARLAAIASFETDRNGAADDATTSDGVEPTNFYARRSAGLPSIGADAGQRTMSTISSMRPKPE